MPKSNQEEKGAVTGAFGTCILGHTSAGLPERRHTRGREEPALLGTHLCVSRLTEGQRAWQELGWSIGTPKEAALRCPLRRKGSELTFPSIKKELKISPCSFNSSDLV